MHSSKSITPLFYAFAAVLFYAITIPVSKIILQDVGPTMVSAFLYLGAGIGIAVASIFRNKEKGPQDSIHKKDLPYLFGMIVLDIVGIILFMNGIARTTAANASLLANLEIAATAVIAYFVFHENVSRKMWIALLLVMISGMILSLDQSGPMQFSPGSLMVIGAALCWGMENNCTKMLSHIDTYRIVTIKGLCAGAGSLIIALLLQEPLPSLKYIGIILLLGFVAYGLSIFAYIRAQHLIGAAKTSAFYSLNPFVSAFLSFLFLKETLSVWYYVGLAFMAAGSILILQDLWQNNPAHEKR